MALRWVPDPVHPDQTQPGAIVSYLVRELRSIAVALLGMKVDFVQMKIENVAPAKPRNGMLVEADGTNWNPGSGAGLYIYRSGSWVKVG